MCENKGTERVDLMNKVVLCPEHYKLTKTLEDKQSLYFCVRGKIKSRQARLKITNFEKKTIRYKTNKMIAAGLIKKKPCEVCGSNNNINVHHYDYTDYMNVAFLCETHHKAWHRTHTV